MHSARAAQLQTTTELGAGQTKRVPQHPQQRHLGRYVDAFSFSIKGELNGWHLNLLESWSAVYTREGNSHKKAKKTNSFVLFVPFCGYFLSTIGRGPCGRKTARRQRTAWAVPGRRSDRP